MKYTKIFAAIICTVVGLSCTTAEAKTVTFAQASDIHYSINASDSTRPIANAPKALKGFVDRVNEKNYDFVMFLGDSIDKSNEKNLTGFLNIVNGINKPYYMVIGNHDAHKISGLTKDEYLAIVSKYNENQKEAKASYYFYPTPEIVALVVDGATSGMPSAHGVFTPKTLKWVDEVLTKNKDKKAIIFQHFPMVEPFENPSHTIMDKSDYESVLNRHDNILLISSGHFHKEAVYKDNRGIYHISAPALFDVPYYFQEVIIKYDKKPFQKPCNFTINGNEHYAI